MSLRINQNIDAFNSYRNLSVTQGQMSKSLEKLSSGFRINRAADDAAGLAISEGLRSQIGGLKVAVRNTQDGVSVVQTAEGALTETHSILQRMRDLAVQSANGSNNQQSRDAINAEATQLKAELNRIAEKTSFNGVNLLDGNFKNQAFQVGYAANDTIDVSVGVATGTSAATAGSYVQSVNLKNDYSIVDNPGSSAVAATYTVGSGSLDLAQDFSVTSGEFEFQVDGDIVSLTSDLSGASDNAVTTAIQSAMDTAAGGTSGWTASYSGGTLTLTDNNAPGAGESNPITAAPGNGSGIDVTGGTFNDGTDAVPSTTSTALDFTVGGVAVQVTDDLSGATDAGVASAINSALTAAGVTGFTASYAAGELTIASSATGAGNAAPVVAGGEAIDGSGTSTAGADAGVSYAAFDSAGLGVDTLDLSSAAGAQSAIAALDTAIGSVSTSRANLGALQNRFEHTINNLNVTAENLSASESRIRDTDMAQEMMNFTRAQILSQAGTAMLAQANQAPQGVLQLLR